METWLFNNGYDSPFRELIVQCNSSKMVHYICLAPKSDGLECAVIYAKCEWNDPIDLKRIRERLANTIVRVRSRGPQEECLADYEALSKTLAIYNLLHKRVTPF